MKHILWIENTDASEEDMSEAMERNVTICTMKEEMKQLLSDKKWDAIVIDDLVENAEQFLVVLEEEVKEIPVLILSQEEIPFSRKIAIKTSFNVREPFDIDAIKDILKKIKK